jgi:hypothetical protein
MNSFAKFSARLGLSDQVVYAPTTVQSFEPGDSRFDVVMLHNSINHLDEDACIHLRDDESARGTYHAILAKVGSLAECGAKLVVRDCSNYNFFALLGVRNPLAPQIEWHKHQAPGVWAALLMEVGFRNPRVKWLSYNRLYSAGKVLMGNRLVSYFLGSDFCLTMTKSDEESL